LKYERERCCLAMSTGVQRLFPGSLSSQLDYYNLKVTAVVSVMLIAADIQGADLSKSLALFFSHTLFLSGMISLQFVTQSAVTPEVTYGAMYYIYICIIIDKTRLSGARSGSPN